MNPAHLELCSSREWAAHLATEVLPWVLEEVEPGGELLEIGPGPGAATDLLRAGFPAVVALESDADLAAGLSRRFADDPQVDVHHGDGTDLPFAADRFSAVACFTMLHHVPSGDAQDRLFAEVARVLAPGGVFFGTDSLDGPGFRRLHEGDTCTPVDPLTLGDRLRAAGFAVVNVAVLSIGVRFVAHNAVP